MDDEMPGNVMAVEGVGEDGGVNGTTDGGAAVGGFAVATEHEALDSQTEYAIDGAQTSRKSESSPTPAQGDQNGDKVSPDPQGKGNSRQAVENQQNKKQRITKETENLLTTATEKEKDSIALHKTPAELLATFRQLARNPQDAQREDDESKCSLLEVVKLRHEFAIKPDGWVARRKRAIRETIIRWGVTDSGALCSRVGPNYQALVPRGFYSHEAYMASDPDDRSVCLYTTSSVSHETKEEYLSEFTTLYQDYVLNRKQERTSYRDFGTFREFALQTLASHGYDTEAASRAVRAAMATPLAFEAATPYEVWTANQARNFKKATQQGHGKNFSQIASKGLVPDKNVHALISFYYRSKLVDSACRRGPVIRMSSQPDPSKLDSTDGMMLATPSASAGSGGHHWQQLRCVCKRQLHALWELRYVWQACPDCERAFCMCPACGVAAMVEPECIPRHGQNAPTVEMSCPNCGHIL